MSRKERFIAIALGLIFMWVGMAAAVGLGGRLADSGQWLLAALTYIPGLIVTLVGAELLLMVPSKDE